MNHNMIFSAYEYEDLADGSTTALNPVYYVLNNMFRETIYPKVGVTLPVSGDLLQICLQGCCLGQSLSLSVGSFGTI
jgi:hypothetical protein